MTTYAEQWADAINEIYTEQEDLAVVVAAHDGESHEDAEQRVLAKAARILRGYDKEATFTGPELDLVRHLMPAHEVHQSGSVHWVVNRYGKQVVTDGDEIEMG